MRLLGRHHGLVYGAARAQRFLIMHIDRLSVFLGLPVFALAGALASGAVSPSSAAASANPEGLRVAVIDFERVLAEYEDFKAGSEKIASMQEDGKRVLAKLNQRLQDLEADIEVQGKTEKLLFELHMTREEGKVRLQQLERQVVSVGRELQLRCYEGLLPKIERFAEVRGIDLLVRKRAWAPTGDGGIDLDRALRRDVLFHTKGLDETEALIEFLK